MATSKRCTKLKRSTKTTKPKRSTKLNTCRKKKISKVFTEWKKGKLRIGKSSKFIKSHKQAIAVALSISNKFCKVLPKRKK